MITPTWKTCRRLLVRMDFLLLFCILLLLLIGVQTIYSAGQEAGGNFAHYWIKQLSWGGIGLAAYLGIALLDYRKTGRGAWLFYAAALVLLVLVLLPGVGRSINRSQSWLPLWGITLQPAELAKPATLFLLAWIASRPGWRPDFLGPLLPLGAVLAIPVLLIGLQPDWGTALVFAGIFIPMIFAGAFPWRYILVGVALAAVLAPLSYAYVLSPKHRSRIDNFVRPSNDITDTGWNAHQSLLAVGSGGFKGKGFMKGTQHVLGFLPRTVAPTDFIFSVIAEENGFIGAAVVSGAFLVIILRCLRIAALAEDEFGAYIAAGVAGLFLTHAYINIGMNIQAAPIIGIPLPLVSYGGSFMLCSLISLGLVQAVYVRHRLAEDAADR